MTSELRIAPSLFVDMLGILPPDAKVERVAVDFASGDIVFHLNNDDGAMPPTVKPMFSRHIIDKSEIDRPLLGMTACWEHDPTKVWMVPYLTMLTGQMEVKAG